MIIQIELWHMITLLLAFFSCVGAFGKILLQKSEQGNQERYLSAEEKRIQATKHWDEKFGVLEQAQRALSAELVRRVEVDDALRVDVAQIKGSKENTPDIGKIYDRINAIADDVSRVSGEMNALQRSVNRVENFLLNRKVSAL